MDSTVSARLHRRHHINNLSEKDECLPSKEKEGAEWKLRMELPSLNPVVTPDLELSEPACAVTRQRTSSLVLSQRQVCLPTHSHFQHIKCLTSPHIRLLTVVTLCHLVGIGLSLLRHFFLCSGSRFLNRGGTKLERSCSAATSTFKAAVVAVFAFTRSGLHGCIDLTLKVRQRLQGIWPSSPL